MKRYPRPLGFLSGDAARGAIARGLAAPLAGGPLAFTLVEMIERDRKGRIARSIIPVPALRDGLSACSATRPPVAGIATGQPIVMGILNVTPDSFSDGGQFAGPDAAIAEGKKMIASGARIIDVGGESTRPGAAPIDPAEEMRRVVPVIAGFRHAATAAGAVISIDTRNAATMRAALEAGAGMVNDVSAMTHDPQSLAVAAFTGAPVVLMHMRGEPATMQTAPAYGDVVLDVYDYLEARIAACVAAGIDRRRIIVDPGIGFGKTVDHNLALIDQLALFHGLGVPLLVGVSRKGFIARLSAGEPPDRRLGGSLAAGLAALGQGAQILRVHDVAETVQSLRVAGARHTA